MGVDIARLMVTDQAGPADAIEGDGGMENIVDIFPQLGAALGVEGGDDTLLSHPLSAAADDENSTVEDDRGRAADKFGMPDQILARGGPGGDQTSFAGDAILCRAAPRGPVCRSGAGNGKEKDNEDGEWNLLAGGGHS